MVNEAVVENRSDGRVQVRVNGEILLGEDGSVHTFHRDWDAITYLTNAAQIVKAKYNVTIGFVVTLLPKKRSSVRVKVIGDPGLSPAAFGPHHWEVWSSYQNMATGKVQYTYKCTHCNDRLENLDGEPEQPALCPCNPLQ